MKILVVGADGDIGSYLIPELTLQGYDIRALVKTQKEADKIRMPGVEVYLGDVTNLPVFHPRLRSAFYLRLPRRSLTFAPCNDSFYSLP